MSRGDSSTPDGVFDDTVDVPVSIEISSGDSGSSSGSGGGARPKVELVAGARPRLSSEIRDLLRSRLRIAAVILLIASAFFTTRNLLGIGSEPASTPLLNTFRVFTTVVLVIAAVMLFSRRSLGLRELRIIELAVFGVLMLLFIGMHENVMRTAALTGEPAQIRYSVVFCVFMWFVILSIYGTFIPNSLLRGSLILGAMGITPVLIIAVMSYQYPGIGEVVIGGGMLPEVIVAMAMVLSTAIYGSYKIGALRQEAFAARQLGQYRLTKRLGAGGMGEVYLAEHQLLKRPCAVKLIRGAQTNDAQAIARFEREVRSMARLSHWNSVEVFDYGCAEDGTFYYAMEYLPGLNLQEVVERQGPMQPERVVHLLRQVCQALAEAHGMGLVHRDIKPSNIIAAARGGLCDVAKLLDFGLATMVDDALEVQLSRDGVVAGSPYYLAPERILEDSPPDARSDIYSLGAVAYFLVCGRPPFRGDKPISVMIAHARDPLVPPSQVNPSVPADLEQIILRCLAKSPDERYQDVVSLGQALGECECAGRWTQALAAAWWAQREMDAKGSAAEEVTQATASEATS